ncbi:hypothetical protein [Legionella fairfieldensis]|uniref:hypothetical protein n=1 Tax=Legionella fairfieldensis TaxID=45064 RepID=UPI000491AECC|nr:hypothetical protein [Legionella fairfieldensis]
MTFEVFTISTPGFLKKIQDALNEGITYFAKLKELGGRTIDPSPMNYRNQLQTAKRLLREDKGFGALKQITTQVLHEKKISEFLDFHETLRGKRIWDKLRRDYPAQKQRLNRLKEAWQHQSAFSHFTVGALFECEDLLQALKTLTTNAQNEARKKRYATEALVDYPHHLQAIQQDITQARQAIAEALFYRLTVALHTGTLNESNPTQFLLNQLKENGIQTFQRMEDNECMTGKEAPFPFVKAVAYIKEHGALSLQNVLNKQLLLTENTGLLIKKEGKHVFLVPEPISSDLSQTSFFLRVMSRLFNLQDYFFRNKSDLLFKLLRLNALQPPQQNRWESSIKWWQELTDLHTTLDVALQDAHRQKNTWLAFFFKPFHRFLERWHGLIVNRKHHLMQLQMTYLQQLAVAPLPIEFAFAESDNPKLLQIKATIQQQLNDIEKQLGPPSGHEKDRQRLKRIRQAVIKHWQLDENNDATPSIESVLSHFANVNRSLPRELLTAFEHALNEQSPAQREALITNPFMLQNMVTQINTTLDELLPCLYTVLPIHESLLYLHQIKRVLALLSSTPNAKDALAPLKTTLHSFINDYQECIQYQPQATLQENDHYFQHLECALLALLALKDDWQSEHKALMKASEARLTKGKGDEVVDTEAYVAQSQEERLLQTEQLNEAHARQETLIHELNTEKPDLEQLTRQRAMQRDELTRLYTRLNGVRLFKEPRGFTPPTATPTTAHDNHLTHQFAS